MAYNWQLPGWPHFSFQQEQFESQLVQFIQQQGQLSGLLQGLPENLEKETLVDIMVMEALKTSEIEGEVLSKQDVLSSIRNNLGLNRIPEKVRDRRAMGVAKLMVELRENFQHPLTEQMLFSWHQILMESYKNLNIGQWRKATASMQIISGSIGREVIHFEAPPSHRVPIEMSRFIEWFNTSPTPQGNILLASPFRSAIAHLYFESIHPFEDGNGRIGRAISEKVLSQGLGQPILFSLSRVIEKNRKDYYEALKKAQREEEVTDWVNYFLSIILEAQKVAAQQISFTILKVNFFKQFANQLNQRQQKVLNRMFDAGPEGFQGGMSAKKYQSISKTSKATATRDLQYLLQINALQASGAGRSIRYHLSL